MSFRQPRDCYSRNYPSAVAASQNSSRGFSYKFAKRDSWTGILGSTAGRMFHMNRRNLLVALMGAGGALAGSAIAQTPASKQPDKYAVVNGHVRELMLLMDTDGNGKISKKEWMSFMEAEFNQLDKDGKGELDPKQLSQSRLVRHDNS